MIEIDLFQTTMTSLDSAEMTQTTMKMMTFWMVRVDACGRFLELHENRSFVDDEDDTPTGQSAGNVQNDSNDDDDDEDYTGLSLLNGDILSDLLGGVDDDDSDEPAKKSDKKKKGSGKQPGTAADDDDDDDDDSEEDGAGGFLELLDGRWQS